MVASFAPQTSIFRSVCMCVARLESEVGSEAVPPKKEHQTQESWHICFQIFQAIFTITVGALAALGRPCLREGSEDLTVTGMLRHDCILGLVRRKHRQTWKTSMPLLLFLFLDFQIVHFRCSCERPVLGTWLFWSAATTHTQRGRGSQRVTLPDLLFRMRAQ